MVVSAVGTLAADDLPVMLDLETAGGQSEGTVVAQITTWLNAVKAGTGKTPIIYTGYYFWNDSVGSSAFSSYADWIAAYGSCPLSPDGWSGWTFWQYADNGSIPGISGDVDLDYFNGTLAQFQSFVGAATCSAPDGFYCGGDQVTGDSNTLYQCSSKSLSAVEACSGWCATGPKGDFCAPAHRGQGTPDVNGDGMADVCGRGAAGYQCWLSTGDGFSKSISAPDMSDAQGWNVPPYFATIQLADVNGDGKADVCGRGWGGIRCWLSDGSAFVDAGATYLGSVSDSNGGNQSDVFTTIQFGDVNGDGKADACARTASGFSCWLADGKGSFSTAVNAPDMGDAQGWNQVQYYSTIQLADVTGDGKADVCGRGYGGVRCWLSDGKAFVDAGSTVYVDAFSDANHGDSPDVFSTIQFADMNGDGKVDVCGRTSSGFFCYLSDGKGAFPTEVKGPDLSDAEGWDKPQYYSTIQMADINGDGLADVCGRGAAGVSCWLSNGSGFPTQITGPALSDASSWDKGIYDVTLQMADVNDDGLADLCGRDASGWSCWISTGDGFGNLIAGPDLSDASGWDGASYVSTLRLPGSKGRKVTASKTSTAAAGSTTGSASTSSGTHSSSSRSSTSSSTGRSTASTAGSSGASRTSSSSRGTTGEGTTGAVATATAGSTSGSTGTLSTATATAASTSGTRGSTGGLTLPGTSSTSASTGSTGTETASASSGPTGSVTAGTIGGTRTSSTSTQGISGSSGGKSASSGGCSSTGSRLELCALAVVVLGIRRRRRYS
jgi:hypothetical protein